MEYKIIYENTISRVGKLNRDFFYNKSARQRLKNKDVTILAHNCLGGVWYHDLGLKFLSPTINLYIMPSHFIKFITNLEFYLKQRLVFKEEFPMKYPVGMLDDITIFFIHYHTAEEAAYCWDKRKERINWNNICLLMSDRFGCSEEILKEYENLPYPKLFFSTKQYVQFSFAYQIKKYKDYDFLPYPATQIMNIFGKRLFEYSELDYVEWLNSLKMIK